MAYWNPEDDVTLTDSEDEEELAIKREFKGREAILFVVDANLQKSGRLDAAFALILDAFLSGLVPNANDMMGLVICNTKTSPLPHEKMCLENIVVPADCAVFMPLRKLNRLIVEHYNATLVNSTDVFETNYGLVEPDGHGNFANMIRLCIELLEKCGQKINNAQIVYLTDVEDPHSPDSNLFQAALQKAKDLEGKLIDFQVLPMKDDFDYEPFYREFITLSKDIEKDAFHVPDAQMLREVLKDRKLRQGFAGRSLGHINFVLGGDLKISAQYFHYFKKDVFPKKVKIERRTNNVVKQKRIIVIRKTNEESQESIENFYTGIAPRWYNIEVGGMSIRLTPDQLNDIRNIHEPQMMLLGFKHRTALPDLCYSKPSNFMYPDDQAIIGSKRLFRALWQRCLEREKIAVCLFLCKRKSIPRYVALVPTRSDQYQKIHSLLASDGFKIVYLPMAKHIRHINLCDWNGPNNLASDEEIDLVGKIVKRLRFKYNPNLFDDPELDELGNDLFRIGLNIDQEDTDGQYDTQARVERFTADVVRAFGEYTHPAKKLSRATASKRNAEPMEEDDVVSKIHKASQDTRKITETVLTDYNAVKQMVENQELGRCTVKQLQFILQHHFQKNVKNKSKDNIIFMIEGCFSSTQ